MSSRAPTHSTFTLWRLAFSVLGISMVAVLSGSAPLRGVGAGCLGVMIAMIGSDPQTGTLRWTMDSLYLWDGLPITPVRVSSFLSRHRHKHKARPRR